MFINGFSKIAVSVPWIKKKIQSGLQQRAAHHTAKEFQKPLLKPYNTDTLFSNTAYIGDALNKIPRHLDHANIQALRHASKDTHASVKQLVKHIKSMYPEKWNTKTVVKPKQPQKTTSRFYQKQLDVARARLEKKRSAIPSTITDTLVEAEAKRLERKKVDKQVSALYRDGTEEFKAIYSDKQKLRDHLKQLGRKGKSHGFYSSFKAVRTKKEK